MTYQETLDYLYAQLPMFTRVGASAYKKDLTNSLALCEALGNPHLKFKSIHVAGTNGKGSSSHMLASILQEAGYKTGLYTSPHLIDFRERIKINGIMIPQEFVVDFVIQYKSLFEEIKPSFFEWTVALCFQYFASQKVEIAIIETGLGGRLDSTNVINPILSIITNIGFDHMDMLGNTLALIAGEKAGIIKKNTPVVIGENHTEINPVFQQKAKSEQAFLCYAEFETELFHFKNNETESHFDIHLRTGETWLNMQCDLPGIYQKKNICTVISSIPFIRQAGFKITESDIKNGLFQVKKNTGLMGRWQLIQNNPKIICDTGHNEHGMKLVSQQLSKVKRKNLHMIIGMVKDKDVSKVLSLMPIEATYYFTKANLPRALDEKELQAIAITNNLKGSTFIDVESAIQYAIQNSDKDDLIFIGASTFIVAEALEYFQKQNIKLQ